MSDESTIMRELYAVREQIYEETKHMTPAERAEHGRREAEAIIAKYNLKVKRPSPPEHLKNVG